MNSSRPASSLIGMLVRVAERIRRATTFDAIAHCVVAELANVGGVRGSALVLCDASGEPALWIGDSTFDRAGARAYLDGGHRDDACFARVRETYVAALADDLWIAPIMGSDRVIG